jgi:hypothetical protein
VVRGCESVRRHGGYDATLHGTMAEMVYAPGPDPGVRKDVRVRPSLVHFVSARLCAETVEIIPMIRGPLAQIGKRDALKQRFLLGSPDSIPGGSTHNIGGGVAQR